MAMETINDKKEVIQRRILETILQGLNNNILTQDDLPIIAEYVLGQMESIQNENELLTFLQSLAEKWQLFTNLKTLEERKVQELEEKDKTQQVLQLTREGKVEEALTLAKTITHNNS